MIDALASGSHERAQAFTAFWMHLDRNQVSGQPPAIVAIDLGRYAPG